MKGKKRMLNRFYAVTKTSIYKVMYVDGGVSPSVKKIALLGKSSVKVGEIIPAGVGDMVSIGEQIIIFLPVDAETASHQRQIGLVKPMCWKGRTSEIVALFLTLKEAKKYWKADDLKTCDKRWIKQTKATLASIGNKHPIFSICNSPGLKLIN